MRWHTQGKRLALTQRLFVEEEDVGMGLMPLTDPRNAHQLPPQWLQPTCNL